MSPQKISPQNVRGILFDKDGTLLDFNRTWLAPYQTAAAYLQSRFNIKAETLLARGGFIAASQTWRSDSPLASGDNREILDFWSGVIGETLTAADRHQLESIFTLPRDAFAPVADDMQALFRELRDAGFMLGLATMDTEHNARQMLTAMHAAELFDFVCGADSGHGVKPDAGMVLAFCRACELQCTQVAMVGDSPRDLEMGKNAGAFTIGVLTGAHGESELAPLADLILPSVVDLLAALR